MIRKLAVYIIFLCTLNGCVQGIALLGPAFSYSQSGNVMHSALSFGSNKAVKKMREMSGDLNKKNSFNDSKIDSDNYSLLLVKK
jgi:hypothetical protein